MYSDEEFDSFSDGEREESGNLIDVSVTGAEGSRTRWNASDSSIHNLENADNSDDDGPGKPPNEKGGKIKLSKKPPDVLLRQYQIRIRDSIERKKYDSVIEDLIRCTALSRILYGDCDWRYAESESELAQAYWKYKNLAQQAQLHCETARNIMLQVVQSGGAQEEKDDIYRVLLTVYTTLGEAHNAQKRFADAELSFQKAEKILVERSKLTRIQTADNNDLKIKLRVAQAKLAANQSKAASSVAYFEEAIALIQSQYGDDSVKLIPLYQLLGKVEQIRDKPNHHQSIEAYLQAHSIAHANYSEGTVELADTGFELALAYARVGESDAETSAESYLNECIATYQSVYGPNHEKTLRCQDELARLMVRTERFDEAIQLLRSTIVAKKNTWGDNSDQLASTYKLLGSVHMSQGNMEKALKAMSKELSKAEQQYRCAQQQHMDQLEKMVENKGRQLAEGRVQFDQLKQDFKYNLRLLQERDEELEQCDATIASLREQVSTNLACISDLSVKLKECKDKCCKLEEGQEQGEKTHHQKIERERAEFERIIRQKDNEHSKDRLDWEADRRQLVESLKMAEEIQVTQKREAESHYEESFRQREREWRLKLDEVNSELLAHQLRANSLSAESDQLRENCKVQTQVVDTVEAAQKQLEAELQQSQWELEDYRAMCTRRIQDLETTIASFHQSKEDLVMKYERKMAAVNSKLAESKERHEKTLSGHNDQVTALNNQIKEVKKRSDDLESQIMQLKWKIEDLTSEKAKLVNEFALEKVNLQKQIKSLESQDNTKVLTEEVGLLKAMLAEARNNVSSKQNDIERYQRELTDAVDQISEAKRQHAQLELDCQHRCEETERKQYQSTETLVSGLSRAKEEALATVKRMEKEASYQQNVIANLKKDLSEAYSTLRSHGLGVKPVTVESTTKLPDDHNNYRDLYHQMRRQNESLKSVISQMRLEMENVGLTTSATGNKNDLYIQSLEQELKDYKRLIREKEQSSSTLSHKEVLDAIVKGDDQAIKNVIQSLNDDIVTLRNEKVTLTALSRKQQVQLEHLQNEVSNLRQKPIEERIELDQMKYELNAQQRHHQTEISSLRQRVADLESQLEGTRQEATEYHRSLIAANTELQSLSTDLSNLKMDRAKSGQVINYGAQELVIQNLQDENERLRGLLKKETTGDGEELQNALGKITKLSKEKAILTELSNRLRAELLRAGINPKKPRPKLPPGNSIPKSRSKFDSSSNQLDLAADCHHKAQGKLEQLENMQYNLTKATMAKSNKVSLNEQKTHPAPSDSGATQLRQVQQSKTVTNDKRTVRHDKENQKPSRLPVPSVYEETSSGDSILLAQGKPTELQTRLTPASKYQPPALKPKPKTNAPWASKGQQNLRKNGTDPPINELTSVSQTATLGESLNPESLIEQEIPERDMAAGNVTDSSLGVGSSIQDVWKLLDEKPSFIDQTPR